MSNETGAAKPTTREDYILAVRALACARLIEDERIAILGAKIVYGLGDGGYRGICYRNAWKNGSVHAFIEIAATGEESLIQLAGTTIHECGHALADYRAKDKPTGHDDGWRAACRDLGLLTATASGQVYAPEHFDPALWTLIDALPKPEDGDPNFIGGAAGVFGPFVGMPTLTHRPCPLGVGTRGGKSRGPGSGSRLRKWVCKCNPPVIARVSSDHFKARCNVCGSDFVRG